MPPTAIAASPCEDDPPSPGQQLGPVAADPGRALHEGYGAVMQSIQIAVIGAGQAGLATSYWLTKQGLDHVLLERGRSGDSWLDRWDSFCLVTPNWTLNLPGFPYQGDDPDGFILRDEIAEYVRDYKAFLDPPVRESTEVTRLRRQGGSWVITIPDGDLAADSVVVATGAFPFPSIPAIGEGVHPDIAQIHSQSYRSPSGLPDGGVLVVGSGQSGAQIVDDLLMDGRQVWFSLGRSAWAPRRYRGMDTAKWLHEMGFMDALVDHAMRQQPSIMVSGRDGGKDLNLRAFGRDGVHLVGRIVGADRMTLSFEGEVADIVDGADLVADEILGQIDAYIAKKDLDAPPESLQRIDWSPGPTSGTIDLEATGVTSIVWATGYHYDFSWIDVDIFGKGGYPDQLRGVTSAPGLYFIGLLGMHTARSGLFSGVGADAEHIADHIAASLAEGR